MKHGNRKPAGGVGRAAPQAGARWRVPMMDIAPRPAFEPAVAAAVSTLENIVDFRIEYPEAPTSIRMRSAFGQALGRTIGRVFRFRAVAMVAVPTLIVAIAAAPLFLAFEGHVLNVTASIVMIDPPVITPPGGDYTGVLDSNINDADPDATHIFYTITPGLDPGIAPDPICGVSAGGPKPIGPITLTDDAVVKAIACDSWLPGAHNSLITAAIYNFTQTLGKIEGRKYHDLDGSGTLTQGDFGVEGWHIDLKIGTSTIAATVTDVNGYYAFTDVQPDTYVVAEEVRSGWEQFSSPAVLTSIVSNETKTVNFFNRDTGFACTPQTITFPANTALQAAGATDANDDVAIANNVTVNGNVRSNDAIEMSGGNGPRTINGNATAVNTVDAGINVTGTTVTGAPAIALPDASIPFWKSQAQAGGSVLGSLIFPNNTTGLSMGPSEIMGDVVFGSSNTMTLKGPLYIHGNLSIGSNSVITQDPGFGDQFATVIVDGTIAIDSNISFNGASSTGTFLLISTHAAVAGDGAAIKTASNQGQGDLGDVVLYASDGDIHVNQNRTFLAAFATHGTGADTDDNAAIRIDQNVTVNYRALPTTVSCGPRQPFETTAHVVINEFMPNPIGDDQGAAGLPHDGEWVELFNPTSGAVNVAGWVLYDSDNTRALPITAANTNTGATLVPALGYLAVYRDGDGDFALNNSGGDSVRLFSDHIGSGGVLVDSHTYVRNAPENKSFARIPDGAPNWIDPDPTPGAANDYFFQPIASTPEWQDYTVGNRPQLALVEPVTADLAVPEEPVDLENPLAPELAAETPTEALPDNVSSTTPETIALESGGDEGATSTSTEPAPASTDSTGSVPANSEQATPTPEPTPTPEEPSPSPTPTPTPEPSPTPTPEPAPTPTPTPEPPSA